MLDPRFVDSREPPSRITPLQRAGFRPKALSAGDVQFPEAAGGTVAIELKSVSQLLGDMRTGKLPKQCRRLVESADFPILLIWGAWAQTGGVLLNTNYTWQQVWNELQTLQDMGVRLRLATSSQQATDEVLNLAEYYAKPCHQSASRHLSGDTRAASLSLVPGIGERKAKVLLSALGSLAAVAQASVEQLAQADGIGLKLARQIRSFFDGK